MIYLGETTFIFRYLLFTYFNGQCDFEGQGEPESVSFSAIYIYQ